MDLQSSTGVVARRATRTEDSISPTAVDYNSDEDDLESVVADLMDHDAFIDTGTEDEVAMGGDVEDVDMEDIEYVDMEDLTSAFGMAQFFQHLENNIEWGGHEYDHNDRVALGDMDDDGDEG